MSIEAIAAIGSPFSFQPTAALAPQPTSEVFQSLVDAVGNINEQMRTNDKAVQAMALGETGNLHEVMMNLEKTRLTFELALQVRNKTLEAYQELMRMQV
ncbi:flagellar hook-basal body complex protein FliE [Steroidobacter flavus]|uniref:Flagellar hook-basal body complex protein FliE n=1 Tax=Steroidobacter flavus TaxID=1842136 RepID=A0ABV8T0K2_9GAMM